MKKGTAVPVETLKNMREAQQRRRALERRKKPAEEVWTMKDGTKIEVGDMSESHVRNALRMVIRASRKRQERHQALRRLVGDNFDEGHPIDYEMTCGEVQDMMSNASYDQLSNPQVYFPLLGGGRHGSPELANRYDPRKK